MIDCGKCGSESMRLADDTYVCARCGKKYTKEMAEQREQALESLSRKRKLQSSTILLPGYADSGSHAVLIIVSTALCLAVFVAAVVVRILYGKARKKLYPGK